MNSLIKSLKSISEKYLLKEKFLVCHDFGTASEILESLAREGVDWINFKPCTVLSLAESLIEEDIIEKGIVRISYFQTEFLIDKIFSKLSDDKDLVYFKKHAINKGIVSALARNISELKSSNIKPKDLKNTCFLSGKKAEDIRLIYESYENELKQKQFADSSDIIKIASKKINKNDDIIYIALSVIDYTSLETEFLEKISGGRLLTAGCPEIKNLPKPKNRLSREENTTGNHEVSNKFQFLFDIENMPEVLKNSDDGAAIELFHSGSCRDEICRIFEILSLRKIRLDEAAIIYTNPAEYLGLIAETCEKTGISAVFSDGLPGSSSRTAKALKMFLLWIKSDFLEVHLRNLLKNNLLRTDNILFSGKVFGGSIAYMLRTSNIGWGKNRYYDVIKKEIEQLKIRISANPDNKEAYENKIRLFEGLLERVDRLFEIIPEISKGQINLKNLCICCINFLRDFIKTSSEDEAAYKKNLIENIKNTEAVSEREVLLEEGIDMIFELTEKTRFAADTSKPGHLAVSSISGFKSFSRKYIFVAGMDENKFPGSALQDPILLDEERENINKSLRLSRDSLKEKLYDFSSLAACLSGNIYFSYSSYDIREEKNMYPSSIMLQVYRLKEGRPDADYKELLNYLEKQNNLMSGEQNKAFIDENSFWISKLLSKSGLRNGEEALLNIYPWLKQGTLAAEKRKSNLLTIYDGWVDPDENELDLRKNSALSFSCTAFEYFASSPFAFFINYILKAQRPQELNRDSLRWLDAKQKGSLMHEVFQLYINKIMLVSKSLNKENKLSIIREVFQEVIEKYREDIPIPSLSVFEQEKASLLRDLDVFIKINETLGKPYLVEHAFGYGGRDKLKINIGQNEKNEDEFINISGKIDRIDICEDGTFNVWDYKTGSAYSYDENAFVNKGKQLQHVLYAKAAENILKKQDTLAVISKCGYILPGEKAMNSGKGCIFQRDPGERDKWQGALRCILNLMANGVFIISDEENPSYIEDEDLYGSSSDKDNIKIKLKNEENKILSDYKRLKEFK